MPHQRQPRSSPAAINPRRRVVAGLVLVSLVMLVIWQVDFKEGREHSPQAASLDPIAARPTNETAPTQNRPHGAVRRDEDVEAGERPEPEGVDASNLYKEAFALYAALTDDQKKMLGEPVEKLEPEKAAELFDAIAPIMELLRQAAEADHCDWAIGPLSFDMRMTHVTKGQELGRLARWNADYLFPSDPGRALGALSAQTRLGEHLSDSLIGWLVQTSFERGAVKVLRENIEHLGEEEVPQAQAFLRSSTLEQTIARAFAGEVQGLETLAARLAGQTPPERLEQLSMLGLLPSPTEGGAAELNAQMEDGEYLASAIRYLQNLQREIPEAMRWPEAQFQSWWKSIQDTMKAEHPFAATMLPSLSMVQSRFQQSQVERAMLDAGLGVLRAEPDRVRDPFSGNAFSYAPTSDGFELRSTFQVQGKPLTMSFPRLDQ